MVNTPSLICFARMKFALFNNTFTLTILALNKERRHLPPTVVSRPWRSEAVPLTSTASSPMNCARSHSALHNNISTSTSLVLRNRSNYLPSVASEPWSSEAVRKTLTAHSLINTASLTNIASLRCLSTTTSNAQKIWLSSSNDYCDVKS